MGHINISWPREEAVLLRLQNCKIDGNYHIFLHQIMWDTEDNTRAVSVTYKAPSLSRDGEKSPSFRLYEIDGGYPNATWVTDLHYL